MKYYGVTLIVLAVLGLSVPAVAQGAGSIPHRGKVGEDLLALDEKIAATQKRTVVDNPSWLDYQIIASLWMTRARLTGVLADYQVAEQALVDAFRVAPEGSGPFITRAKLHLTLHRLDPALADIERALKILLQDNATVAELRAMRADIWVQRGLLKAAEAEYKAALALEKTTPILIRLAQIAWKTGNFPSAIRQLDAAAKFARQEDASPLTLAYLKVHRGILELDRGRPDTATVYFAEARDIYPGWYLAEEHLAETLTLLGKPDEARVMYEDIVARVPAGEFMDALADLLEKTDAVVAKQWRDKARQAFEADLTMFPEAAVGHALGHYLGSDDQVPKAVELAEKNAALRGGGEALTQLAQAYVRAKRIEDAVRTIDTLMSQEYRTAESLGTAAIVYRLAQKTKRAKTLEKAARRLNPHIMADLGGWVK